MNMDGGMTGMTEMAGGSLMHMTFFWGEHAQILFSDWPGYRPRHVYILALFLVAVIAAVCEALSVAMRRFRSPASATAGSRTATSLALTAVHAIKMGLLYLVMLAVMSFNVGVLIAAIVGHAVGFLICGSGLVRWAQSGSHKVDDDILPSSACPMA